MEHLKMRLNQLLEKKIELDNYLAKQLPRSILQEAIKATEQYYKHTCQSNLHLLPLFPFVIQKTLSAHGFLGSTLLL